ncbi:MAG: hypothetical protein V4658_13770 [Bacteroidota bacterium]
MKNKNYIFVGVALIATLLTACSNQKFAFRQKVKADRHETAFVAKPKVKATEVKVLMAEPAVSQSGIAVAITKNTGSASAAPTKSVSSAGIDRSVTAKQELAKEPVATAKNSTKNIDKATKLIKKTEHVTKPNGSIDARKFIIVGLILILIGVILALVSGVLGGLLITIGFVVAIIGLIVLLMDNV